MAKSKTTPTRTYAGPFPKVVREPVRTCIPIYSPGDVERHRRADADRRAAIERNEKEMRERRAERESLAARKRRQAIIDDLKIIR